MTYGGISFSLQWPSVKHTVCGRYLRASQRGKLIIFPLMFETEWPHYKDNNCRILSISCSLERTEL